MRVCHAAGAVISSRLINWNYRPERAYDGMPKSAIATNAVDLVLPVGEMVTVLDEYFNRLERGAGGN